MEVDNNIQASTPETTVANPGGPQIPGLGGAPLNPPNNNGVVGQPVAAVPAAAAETPAQIPLDIEALKAALDKDKGGPEPAAAERELAATGNQAIDAGITMLKQVSGLTDADMVRALGKAVEYQDLNLIDSAFIKERFGEHAGYAEMLAKAYLEDQLGQADKAVQEAYSIVGGKEQWEVAAQLFNSKAPEAMRAAAKALADSGKLTQAVQLVASYCQDTGLVATQNPLVRASGAVNTALSAADFRTEYTKLRQEAGNRSLESPKFSSRYNDLMQRREAGRRMGI